MWTRREEKKKILVSKPDYYVDILFVVCFIKGLIDEKFMCRLCVEEEN